MCFKDLKAYHDDLPQNTSHKVHKENNKSKFTKGYGKFNEGLNVRSLCFLRVLKQLYLWNLL